MIRYIIKRILLMIPVIWGVVTLIFLINTFAPLVLNTAMMLFYFIVMIRYSVLLALIGVGAIFLNLAVSSLVSAKRVNITRVQQRDEAKLSSSTMSGIRMIETIKSSGA